MRTAGTAADGAAAMRMRRRYCAGQRLRYVVASKLGLLPLGPHRNLCPGQPVHITELRDAWLAEALELQHGLQDARACPWWQGNDADGLGYSDRSVTGIRTNRSGQKHQRDLGLCRCRPGVPAGSIASDRRRPAALGARKACGACTQDYPSLTTVTSGTGGRTATRERA